MKNQEIIDNLFSDSFREDVAPLNPFGELMDYPDYKNDVKFIDGEVYAPTEYKVTYNGTNTTDDPSQWTPIDYRVVFTREQVNKEVLALEQDSEEARNEFTNVITDKN